MKKYYIKDDDDQEYEVIETEVEEEPKVEDEGVEALSEEDIAALKMLASIADKLAALVSENEAPAEEPIEEEEVVEEEDVVEDEEEFVEEKKEEVVDTCKKDSKSSFGALEKRTKANDEAIVDDISIAWAKRYGGK